MPTNPNVNGAESFTSSELKWAKKQAKLLGIKDPVVLLNMRWSEVSVLLQERGLDWRFEPLKSRPRKSRGNK